MSCLVLIVQQGGGQCISPKGGSLPSRSEPFGLIAYHGIYSEKRAKVYEVWHSLDFTMHMGLLR